MSLQVRMKSFDQLFDPSLFDFGLKILNENTILKFPKFYVKIFKN